LRDPQAHEPVHPNLLGIRDDRRRPRRRVSVQLDVFNTPQPSDVLFHGGVCIGLGLPSRMWRRGRPRGSRPRRGRMRRRERLRPPERVLRGDGLLCEGTGCSAVLVSVCCPLTDAGTPACGDVPAIVMDDH
jgi:hypothetical protein